MCNKITFLRVKISNENNLLYFSYTFFDAKLILGKFSSNYKITIGADFALKTLNWNPHTKISLQLWY